MATQLSVAGLWLCAGLWLAAACGLPGGAARAQSPAPFAGPSARPLKERTLSSHTPDKPSQPPAFSIPVDPLGFSPPNPFYLGSRFALASLDFVDEDHLLFTFRVPGLIRRDSPDGEVRRIRAVLLDLPSGAVQAEALWTLHDHARYLWMLNNGRFLLRNGNLLYEGDASLLLKPVLQFPGPLLSLNLDPRQQFLATNSFEPVKVPAPGAAPASSDSGDPDNPPLKPPDIVVRLLRRASGDVLLLSRVRQAIRLPINSEGYLESLRSQGNAWMLNLNDFTGGSRIAGRVDSGCMPLLSFLTDQQVLATTCSPDGGDGLVALNLDQGVLWADRMPDTEIWPELVPAAGRRRFAREVVVASHPVNAYSPLSASDIKAQMVRVFDAATGEVVFETPVSPILDVGGNVALSPSGRRVAVINAGAIQVFELPLPPSAPAR